MTAWCEALVARAAGLKIRLLDPAARGACARVTELHGLARELAARGYAIEPAVPTAMELETAIRRSAAARLRLLARWDPEGSVATILLAPEELRSLRALARGALEGLSPDTRLDGLIATPALSERALGELARQATVRGITALLVSWHSPWAEAFAEARGTEPDLLAIENGLAQLLARRTLAAARRSGLRFRDFARESVDLLNLRCAVLLAGRADEVNPASFFLAGGGRVTRDGFLRAATAPDAAALVAGLAGAFSGTGIESLLVRHAGRPAGLERALEEWRLATWRRLARLEPLTAAPVIAYVLALRDEVTALQRMVWSIALGAPSAGRGPTPAGEAA